MRKILLAITILSLISCQNQQEKYLITGNVEDIPDSTVINLYINYHNLGTVIKKDTILGGFFEFTDTLENRPSQMSLRIHDFENYCGSCDLWVDYEKIHITGKGKYLSEWNVKSNIKEQIALNNLNNKTKELSIISDSLNLIRRRHRRDRELANNIYRKTDSIFHLKCKIELEFIKQNPNSQSAIERLYDIANFDTLITKGQISNAYNMFDPVYKNTLYGEGIMSKLEDKTIPEIGDKMVDLMLFDIDGKQHRLKDYKEKYILLDFWSMGCGPCVIATPELREVNSKFKDNLTVIGISMDTNSKMWEKASKRDSITWINLSDGKGSYAGASAVYGIYGFPTYILINPEGMIVDKWMGFWKGVFNTKLNKHLTEEEI